MKRIIMAGFILAAAHLGMAQNKATDPSISVNNYKHPDKAAYAKANNLDRQTEFVAINVSDQDAYKHPKKKERTKRSASIPSATGMSPAASHKHPLGL